VTWPHIPLRDLLDEPLRNGRSVKGRDNGFPVLRLTSLGGTWVDLQESKHGDWTRADALPFMVKEGDFLVSRGNGSLNRVANGSLVGSDPSEVAFPDTMIRVRPRIADLDQKYLALAWSAPAARTQIESKARTTAGIYKVAQRDLESVTLPVPSLLEQRRIVELLEEHLSRIDAADAELARARSRSDALLLTVLRAHVEELRSEGAPFARIGDVAETNLGKMLDAKKAHGEPTPYLANINVRWGRFDLETLKVVPLTTEERSRLTMMPGDIIVCEGGEPGRCAVWDLDNSGIAYQKALHRVRVHDTGQLEPKYLALMLRESIQSGRVDRLFTGTTIKHLPQEKLRLVEVPVPEHSVQEAALEELAAVVLSGERLAAALQIAKLRSDSLRRAVLAAALEGRLTGRHTDAEAIEEALTYGDP